MKKIDKSAESVVLINCFQAMNHFQLNGRNRRIATKHTGEEKTVEEWESTFKSEKLIN